MKTKNKELKNLIRFLEKNGDILQRKSDKSWRHLRDHKLPDNDAVISAIYDLQKSARILTGLSHGLKIISHSKKGKI